MKQQTLESGQLKLKQICTALQQDTLEPAKKQAQAILAEAELKAQHIVEQAQERAEGLLVETHRRIEHERKIFQAALSQAGKQAIEALKQTIENKLFNPELHSLVEKSTADATVVSKLITAIIQAIDSEGVAVNIEALVPKNVSIQEVNQLLTKEILKKLKHQTVAIDDFAGGAKIRLQDRQLCFEVSNVEVEVLLKRYVRKEFRKHLFENP